MLVTVTALAAFPLVTTGTASAQAQSVDEKTGPVAFANVASLKVSPGGTLITETQRSPLSPGQSKLGTDRVAVPKDSGERSTFGGSYEIDLGKFSGPAQSPYPAGIASRDHNVVAALQQTLVPTAVAETNYALRDLSQGGARPVDDTVLVLEGAKTSVDCTSAVKLTSTSTVSRLWVRGTDGSLSPVAVPSGGNTLQLKNLKLGPPGEVNGASKATTVSDIAVSRVTNFDGLIRQDGWRDGDFTAAAGWRLEVTTHVRDSGGNALQDIRTSIVLGGISCSIPKNFVARSGSTGAGANASQAPVPTQVPAGYISTAAPERDSASRIPLGIGLLFGGVFFATLALLLGRRRKASRDL